MQSRLLKVIGRGIPYAPPAAVLSAAFLNLSIFQRQFLMLVLLIWGSCFYIFRSWQAP